MPVFWIGGEDLALIIPVVSGTRCVLMSRWDVKGALQTIEEYRVTHLVGSVDTYVEILEYPGRKDHDVSSLRLTLGASFVRRLDAEVRRAWRDYAGAGAVLREGAFGMTETHSMDTSTAGFQDDDADLRTRPVFCGLPVPGTEIKIVDFGTGALVGLDAEGEIAVRSPSITTGYWRNPSATAEALRDGWLHTGDIGVLDQAGCLHFLGRRKEMLKVKGMSVFPAEVEALLSGHPAIKAVAVVPRVDAARGETPVAFVELHSPVGSAAARESELSEWARHAMASYKVPEIRVVPTLPRTDTGKIKKGELITRVQAKAAG
jgi:acyl-CoA synthetase (AMP-forming)/AMP-acid ligase II